MSLAITSPTGKLGQSILTSILTHNLHPPTHLILCTSTPTSSPKYANLLKSQGVGLSDNTIEIRYSNYNDPASMVAAFQGCTKLLLVSSPEIALDYDGYYTPGHGREERHIAAITAAQDAGVEHIYYTSLGFGGGGGADHSKAGVMRAHLLTEEFLSNLPNMKTTIIREGIYNESWPLYLGFYFGLKGEMREEIVLAGDGAISFTSIADLGLATALIITASASSEEYVGKTVNLSQSRAVTLRHVAKMVSDVKGKDVGVKIVSREEFCRYYVEEKGMDRDHVEWWSTTYDALKDNECLVEDATLTRLLASKGVQPKQIEETIKQMLS